MSRASLRQLWNSLFAAVVRERQSRYLGRYYQTFLFPNLDGALGSGRSADALVPLLIDMLHPKSVVDFGCGAGSWLAALEDLGIHDVLGVDGPHLDRRYLRIDPSKVLTADLSDSPRLNRRFDVALCLEVAGYIPPPSGENLIRTLTDAAPVIVFSAPIPSQDDDRVQVNQQWPDYWSKLFASKDFVPVDCIRKRIWSDSRISWWFRQNIVLYVHKEHLATQEAFRNVRGKQAEPPMRLVHPQHYAQIKAELRQGLLRQTLKRVLPHWIKALIGSAKRKFNETRRS
jgi:SAM-dependent methyltransferase